MDTPTIDPRTLPAYRVDLIDRHSGHFHRIVVRAQCTDGMQEFVDTLPGLPLDYPVVVDIARLTHRWQGPS